MPLFLLTAEPESLKQTGNSAFSGRAENLLVAIHFQGECGEECLPVKVVQPEQPLLLCGAEGKYVDLVSSFFQDKSSG